MAFSKVVAINLIEILENEIIQVRIATRVFEDADMIGERYMRYVLEPGQDVSAQPLRIRRIANLIWTPQVVADYQTWKAAQRP